MRAVYGIVWEESKTGRNTGDTMALAHFTLGTSGYKHTFSECVILNVFYCNNSRTFEPQC